MRRERDRGREETAQMSVFSSVQFLFSDPYVHVSARDRNIQSDNDRQTARQPERDRDKDI